ncbi:MAG: hypothetical protein LBD02_06175 [Christensenellaceae bacterium]|jgi:hypothetical protein|nr:hypothetical protein [Christensenellaceae bacterium]
MSDLGKRTLTSLLVGLGSITAYALWALRGSAPAGDDLRAWALAMLLWLGGSIALQILAQIAFHIALAVVFTAKMGEEEGKRLLSSAMTEDERERLLSWKAARVGQGLAGLGLVAALALLGLGAPPAAALHALLGGFALDALAEGVLILLYAERGASYG